MSFPPKVNYGALNLICYFAIVFIYIYICTVRKTVFCSAWSYPNYQAGPAPAKLCGVRFSLGLSGQKIQTYLLLGLKKKKKHCLWVCSGKNSCATVDCKWFSIRGAEPRPKVAHINLHLIE